MRPFPRAAMFALAEEGRRSLLEQVVACIVSIRTRDEVSLVVARRLFAAAPTADALAQLSVDRLDALIRPATFHTAKARQILEIAQRAVAEFGGALPCDREVLLGFPGVGPKCANLALGIACGQRLISVDVHVHRIVNRWGYVATRDPEATMAALERALPPEYWVEINALLVPFGKHICTPLSPRCSSCPVLDMCQQVGVTEHR